MFPRYQIGDIVQETFDPSASILNYPSKQQLYVIVDKMISAANDNMADMYCVFCFNTESFSTQILQDVLYHSYRKVA